MLGALPDRSLKQKLQALKVEIVGIVSIFLYVLGQVKIQFWSPKTFFLGFGGEARKTSWWFHFFVIFTPKIGEMMSIFFRWVETTN